MEELFDDSNDVCEGLLCGVGGVQEVERFFKEQSQLGFILRFWIGGNWNGIKIGIRIGVRIGVSIGVVIYIDC